MAPGLSASRSAPSAVILDPSPEAPRNLSLLFLFQDLLPSPVDGEAGIPDSIKWKMKNHQDS